MNVVTAYSNSGGYFGFQASPRLKALTSPQPGKNSGAADVLDPLSFPVLIIIGIDKDDLRLTYETQKDGPAQLMEPTLQFRQTTRWIPAGDPRERGFFGQRPQSRLSEVERMSWAAHLAAAADILKQAQLSDSTANFHNLLTFANNRIDMLHYRADDSFESQNIPETLILSANGMDPPAASGIPTVTSIFPPSIAAGPAARPTTQPVYITGASLDAIDAATLTNVEPILPKNLAPDATPTVRVWGIKPLGKAGIELAVSADKVKDPTLLIFGLHFKDQHGNPVTTLTPPLTIVDPDAPSDRKIARSKTDDGKGNQSESVNFSAGVPGDLVRTFIRGAATQPTGNGSSINMRVDAGGARRR